MRHLSLLTAALFATCLSAAPPAAAQGVVQTPSATSEPAAADKAARSPRKARVAREPTAGQMAARERQRKCGAEWKEAKAANRTGGVKWPQFWSSCNARLKGNRA